MFIPLLAYLIGSGGQIEFYADVVDSFSATPVDTVALKQGNTPWIVGTAAAVGLFVSVLLHELGHAWVAIRYDIEIESITLWILGGMAALSRIPKEWNREFWIAVAGPFVSLLVAVGCYAVVTTVAIPQPVVLFVLGWLAITNVILVVFNLLPAFPMDGGRVLRALLARRRPHARATQIAARIGVFFALLFAILGIFGSPLLILLALFIYIAAKSESRITMLGDLLEGYTAGELLDADLPQIAANATVGDFADRMLEDRATRYLVTDAGGVVGVVTLSDLKGVQPSERDSTTVGELTDRDTPRVDVSTPVFDAMMLFEGSGRGYILVDRDDEVVGLMSERTIGNILALQQSGIDTKRVAEPF